MVLAKAGGQLHVEQNIKQCPPSPILPRCVQVSNHMRIQHRFLTFQRDPKLIELLDQYTVRYKVTEKSFDLTNHIYALEFFLYEDHPRFTEIKMSVDDFELTAHVGTLYEKQDYDNAEWFILQTGHHQYPQPENSYLEESFNLDNYCRFCGLGKLQDAPIRLKTQPRQHNCQFWGLHWIHDAVFVNQQAQNLLAKMNLNGVRFSNPVLHKTSEPIDGFYQLHIDNQMVMGFDSYNSIRITCKFNNEEHANSNLDQHYCGRVKYHHPMIGGYVFPMEMFEGGRKIFETFEEFGSGAAANRLHIVSKTIKTVIEENMLKGVNFVPVLHHRLSR
jgi:hypothetical protein